MLANLVAETSSTGGTGDFFLDGAVDGRQSFSTAFGTGADNPFRYVIDDGNGNYEIGRSYLRDTTTLARNGDQEVIDSSDNSNPVNFFTGSKSVFCDAVAADILAEATRDHGSVNSGTLTLDARFGWHAWTVAGAHSIAFSNWPAGARAIRALITDAQAHDLTWPSAVQWDGGAEPSWSLPKGEPDLSTASLNNNSFNFNNQDSKPFGHHFKPDGTKLWMCGNNNRSVYQYTLSTPYDASTLSYDNASLDVSAQVSTPYALFLKPDGYRMWIIDFDSTNSEILQYTLTTAWNLNSASYDNVTLSVGGQDSGPVGLAFREDGTRMLVAGNTSEAVYQYTLTTAWDISTAVYDGISLDVSVQPGSPTGLAVTKSGKRLFVCSADSDEIQQFTMTSPWDLTTASFDESLDVSTEDDQIIDISFNQTQDKMHIIGLNNIELLEYDLNLENVETPSDIVEFISPNQGGTIYGRHVWAFA